MNEESKNNPAKALDKEKQPELKEHVEASELTLVEDSNTQDKDTIPSIPEDKPQPEDPVSKDISGNEPEQKTKVTSLPKVVPGVIIFGLFFLGLILGNSQVAFGDILAIGSIVASTIWWSFSVIKTHMMVRDNFRGNSKYSIESVKSVTLTKSLHILVTLTLIVPALLKVNLGAQLRESYTPPWIYLFIVFILIYWLVREFAWATKLSNFISSQKSIKKNGEDRRSRLSALVYGSLITFQNFTTMTLGTLLAPVFVFLNNRNVNSLIDKSQTASEDTKNKKLVRYRKYAAIEKWLLHRFTGNQKKYSKPFQIFILILTPILIAGGFLTSLEIIYWLPSLFSTDGGSSIGALKSNSKLIVATFLGALFTTFMVLLSIYRKSASHLEFSESGLRVLRQDSEKWIEIDSSSWDKISEVTINNQSTKSGAADSVLIFHRIDKTEPIRINLSSVPTIEEKQDILNSIEKYAPKVKRSTDVIMALQLPAEHSYTELWLQALAAPPKREKLQPLQSGSHIRDGRYKVEKRLGVGGQGFAYLAVDNSTEKTVVLKEFILPVFVDINVRKAALEQFESEAKILAQLDHPQIVKLEDFMVEDHRAYLVLEHIDGLSLRQIVKENGPMDENTVQGLAKQMCTVLEYLHEQSPPVVHRDFTPDNLILASDGTLKLIDFNVAQQTDSTTIAKVVGKQSYLPTEQFQGKPTSQSDIYAMGCTLNYLLTGSDPQPISQSKPKNTIKTLTDEIDNLVAKATENKLDNRYKEASQILEDLDYEVVESVVKESEPESQARESVIEEEYEKEKIDSSHDIKLDAKESEPQKIHLKEVEEQEPKALTEIEEEDSVSPVPEEPKSPLLKEDNLPEKKKDKRSFRTLLKRIFDSLACITILAITVWFTVPGIRPIIDVGYKQGILFDDVRTLYGEGKLKSALAKVDEVLAIEYTPKYANRKASFLFYLGERQKAFDVLNTTATKFPDDIECKSMLSLYKAVNGQPEESVKAINEAIDRGKESVIYKLGAKEAVRPAYYLRASASLYNNNPDQALKDYQRIATDFSYANPQFLEALALGLKHDADRTIEIFNNLDYSKKSYYQLYGLFHDTDTMAKVQTDIMNNAKEKFGSKSNTLGNMVASFANFTLFNFEQAGKEIDKTIAVEPDYAYALSLKANILSEQGKLSEAKLLTAKALNLEPQNPYAICLNAYLAKGQDEIDSSIKQLSSVINSESPFNDTALFLRGSLYEKSAQYEKAYHDFASAIDYDITKSAPGKRKRTWVAALVAMLDAKFKAGDYRFVVDNTPKELNVYVKVRGLFFERARLAKLLSDSYSILGDKENARKYKELQNELGYSNYEKISKGQNRPMVY